MRRRAVVVDANIARSAGVKTACAAACAETLATIEDSGHDASFCQQLLDEWITHASSFAGAWLAGMIKSGRIRNVALTEADFKNFARSFPPKARKAPGFEDLHLILTAQRDSKPIISNDDTARKFFSRAPMKIQIHWSDPCRDEQTLAWVEKGFPARKDLLLANYPNATL